MNSFDAFMGALQPNSSREVVANVAKHKTERQQLEPSDHEAIAGVANVAGNKTKPESELDEKGRCFSASCLTARSPGK